MASSCLFVAVCQLVRFSSRVPGRFACAPVALARVTRCYVSCRGTLARGVLFEVCSMTCKVQASLVSRVLPQTSCALQGRLPHDVDSEVLCLQFIFRIVPSHREVADGCKFGPCASTSISGGLVSLTWAIKQIVASRSWDPNLGGQTY